MNQESSGYLAEMFKIENELKVNKRLRRWESTFTSCISFYTYLFSIIKTSRLAPVVLVYI